MKQYNWKGEVVDLSEKWVDKEAAYNWAIAELMPKCHKNILFRSACEMIGVELLGLCMIMLPHPEDLLSGWMTPKKMSSKLSEYLCRRQVSPGSIVMGYAKSGDDLLATVNNYGIGYVVSDYYASRKFLECLS